jgi:hypothetical protein
MKCCKKERRFVAVLTWFLLVGGGILFLGCDHVQGLLGIGGGDGGEDNNEVPDVPPPPVAFRTYYVAASGNGFPGNDGTSEAPFGTVALALGKLTEDYAQKDWLNKGEPNEGFGVIIIKGAVTVSSAILIEGADYPSIVLRGESGSGSTLTWSGDAATDYLLKITSGAKVTLDEDLTLTRTTANEAMVYVGTDSAFTMNGGDIAGKSLKGRGVYVDEGGAFTMKGGTISGNSITDTVDGKNYGGGVYVASNGAFIMNKGTITGNSATAKDLNLYSCYGFGGGVYVADNGAFTMNDGTISGNKITLSSNYGTSFGRGGGVYVFSGGFTMNGGTISGNTVEATKNGSVSGGGVFVSSGGFTMNGGTISANSIIGKGSYGDGYGGGVFVAWGGFTMNDGTISGNKFTLCGGFSSGSGSGNGGGVVVANNGTFTMKKGTISANSIILSNTNGSGNGRGGGMYVTSAGFMMDGGTISGNFITSTGSGNGGGVYVVTHNGTFTMNGGTISGNTVNSNSDGYGGGVYVDNTRFLKNGGSIIYGANEDTDIKNTASSGQGHAVYVYVNESSPIKKRDITAGEGVPLDSDRSPGWGE